MKLAEVRWLTQQTKPGSQSPLPFFTWSDSCQLHFDGPEGVYVVCNGQTALYPMHLVSRVVFAEGEELY